jgi:hypothetical protein
MILKNWRIINKIQFKIPGYKLSSNYFQPGFSGLLLAPGFSQGDKEAPPCFLHAEPGFSGLLLAPDSHHFADLLSRSHPEGRFIQDKTNIT